jgi:hypothetical protein
MRFWNNRHQVRNNRHQVRNNRHQVRNNRHQVRNNRHQVRNNRHQVSNNRHPDDGYCTKFDIYVFISEYILLFHAPPPYIH